MISLQILQKHSYSQAGYTYRMVQISRRVQVSCAPTSWQSWMTSRQSRIISLWMSACGVMMSSPKRSQCRQSRPGELIYASMTP